MRRVLEAIVSHPPGRRSGNAAGDPALHQVVLDQHGPYNNLTARKFVLKTTPQALAAAAKAAASAGASFPTQANESVDQLLTRLGPMFFDPSVDPIVTNKTPGAGKDILSSSANNLYSGVSLADLRGFTEKYGLNSRLVKTNGRLVEEVYRVGGRYDDEIRQIIAHLEAAIPFATEPMANALRALIQWYHDRRDRRPSEVRHRLGR